MLSIASRNQAMSSIIAGRSLTRRGVRALVAAMAAAIPCALPCALPAQSLPTPPPPPSQQSNGNFQGSVAQGEVSQQPIDLSLDDAIQLGLRNNLGILLSGTQASGARGQRLSQLQSLLPSVDLNAQASVQEVDLPAEGLRIPGFPTIIGPFGFVDLRAKLSWSLVNVNSIRTYLAARHNFSAAQLTAQ